ncbi:TRAP transporter substrate-binding protein DctP [Paracraurococcus lichenis]|uniref:TRAP transporter substrate-binding protein DctP n=1 Tax=Paracraurococcus lichenis TaxID=3064888 RepID=A0ABT9EAZ8_9PROT|nr:TRAP transporter substrate-binding protein DctP [Paracraurococcus sp. LOR1-02]MDO9713380.1 TRAP transporter substrate-binding protein DctP [Paracraurococcus sp. LOR1-02]
MLAGLLATGAAFAEEPPIELDVLGGLAVISQYERLEKPFWIQRLPEITQGRVHARIQPFDRSGIAGQEVLRLLRLGVLSYGNILLGLAAAEEPELNAVDLPLLSPDIAALRRTVEAWRPWMEEVLRDRFGLEPLAVYSYPAQVLFCRDPFQGLEVAGRRIRTSSVGQSELVRALGGTPVVIPFAEIMPALRDGVVSCAITSVLAGQAIELQAKAPHVGRIGLSWGLSVFVANQAAWQDVPEDLRVRIRQGIGELERAIWEQADRESAVGPACGVGPAPCGAARPVPNAERAASQDDTRRRRLLTETIIPRWMERCGLQCARAWNRHMAPVIGVTAEIR